MVLNKFQEQMENMVTSEILGNNYGCRKCGINKIPIIKSSSTETTKTTKTAKTSKTTKTIKTIKTEKKIKKTKSSLVNKILLILIMGILIYVFSFNIGTFDYLNLNRFNGKINSIKYFILSKINFYSKPEINY